MPVKDVELHGGHRVQIALYRLDRHPVARGIQHQASPNKTRLVFDVYRRNFETLRARNDQLSESLKTAQSAGGRSGF